MIQPTLFMLLLGCRPKGRYTEQHDVLFGIGNQLKDLIPAIKKSWPEAAGEIHIDAWRAVNCVDGYVIKVETLEPFQNLAADKKKENDLFFINLGGYKENEFEEFHYKMLVVADSIDMAKAAAKKTAFFKHTTLANSDTSRSATSHIDDKYGIDVDDIFTVKDILPAQLKEQYRICITAAANAGEDASNLGYLRLKDL